MQACEPRYGMCIVRNAVDIRKPASSKACNHRSPGLASNNFFDAPKSLSPFFFHFFRSIFAPLPAAPTNHRMTVRKGLRIAPQPNTLQQHP